MIRIIIAEDHVVVRNGIHALLERVDDFTVVAEASNGTEVLDILNQGIEADIILADIHMPKMGGIELTKTLKELNSPVKVLLLTMLDHENFIFEAFQSGAQGYLLKSITRSEMVFAVQYVHQSGRYLSAGLALRFVERRTKKPIFETDIVNSEDIDFSDRELEVLELLSDGYTSQEIADKLFTSKRTVEGHRQAMLEKTGMRNATALVKFATIHGLLS